jgi:hypothetical protein
MNPARVAELLREQARIATELAEEFESTIHGDAPPPPKSRPKRRAPAFPAPVGDVSRISDTDRARAQQQLRRRGIRP